MGNKYEDRRDKEIMDRALKVWSLRLAGFTHRQIGDKLNISRDTVRRDIERIKVDYPEQTARELAGEQNFKLVEMMKPQYLKAVKGDGRATGTMLKLMDHQAKLFGLYNVELEGESSQAVEMLKQFFGLIRDDGQDADDADADQ